MQTPLEIRFTNMEPSDAVERRIREKVAHLERTFGRIVGCHVFVDAPHQHAQQGAPFAARIELRVPGGDIAVGREPGDPHAHADVYVAIRDAFEALERRLRKHQQRMSGEVKAHGAALTGRIDTIDYEQRFGRIIAADGRLAYFHANAVTDGSFNLLVPGTAVELAIDEESAEQGPHASMVRRVANVATAGGREQG
jgi:ribosomal subunit interface protein